MEEVKREETELEETGYIEDHLLFKQKSVRVIDKAEELFEESKSSTKIVNLNSKRRSKDDHKVVSDKITINFH